MARRTFEGANDGICEAKTRKGHRCGQKAVKGRFVCRIHGGLSCQPGPDFPTTRHGRYSKSIPTRLRDRYESALADPELLAMREQYALLDALIQEKLTELGSGDGAAQLWGDAGKALGKLRAAMKAQDAAAVTKHLKTLEAVIENGLGAQQREADIRTMVQEQTSVAAQEVRRLQALDSFITAKQGLAFVAAVVDAVTQEVPDAAVRNRIGQRLNRLVDLPAGAGV